MMAWRYARWVAGGVAAVLSRHWVQPWVWAVGGLRVSAVKRMLVMKWVFVEVVFRRGRVGDGGIEADFSTSLQSGRTNELCWVEGMVKKIMRRGKKLKSKKTKSRSSVCGEGLTTKIQKLTERQIQGQLQYKYKCGGLLRSE
jgi:hypothetical protein